MAQLFANNASTTLASNITSIATTLTVSAGSGALFPSPTGGDYFLITIVGLTSGVETSWEIIKVTARSTDTLTIVRAQESTTAAAWTTGTKIELRLTAGSMNTVGPIVLNQTTVSSNKSIDAGVNGLSFGPITISSGASVSIASGQRYIII